MPKRKLAVVNLVQFVETTWLFSALGINFKYSSFNT